MITSGYRAPYFFFPTKSSEALPRKVKTVSSRKERNVMRSPGRSFFWRFCFGITRWQSRVELFCGQHEGEK